MFCCPRKICRSKKRGNNLWNCNAIKHGAQLLRMPSPSQRIYTSLQTTSMAFTALGFSQENVEVSSSLFSFLFDYTFVHKSNKSFGGSTVKCLLLDNFLICGINCKSIGFGFRFLCLVANIAKRTVWGVLSQFLAFYVKVWHFNRWKHETNWDFLFQDKFWC